MAHDAHSQHCFELNHLQTGGNFRFSLQQKVNQNINTNYTHVDCIGVCVCMGVCVCIVFPFFLYQ